jgi:hypothetical protein
MKLSLLAATLLLTATAAQAQLPHYVTPTGLTTVQQYGTVGCFAVEDALEVASNRSGRPVDVDGLIAARRCLALPVGTPVLVVERVKEPNGKDMKPVCVKPAGDYGPLCVWLLIQQLDVKAD